MSSWNNPGGYNNGYAPNAGIQLETVVTDIITNSLNQIARSNSYPGPVLDETYKRLLSFLFYAVFNGHLSLFANYTLQNPNPIQYSHRFLISVIIFFHNMLQISDFY